MADVAATDSIPQWQRDLDNVGFVRRLLLARKWYGADWWFVVISGILLLFIFSMAFFPRLYAPYDPHQEVGPSLVPPGQVPPSFVLVGKENGILDLDALTEGVKLGIVRGSESTQVLRDVVARREAELDTAGQTVRLRPQLERYDTIEEALADVTAGEIDVAIGLREEIEPLLPEHADLVVGQSLSGAIQEAFMLGTNQLGQDMLSRVVWGTRTALLVGFSAAIVSLFLGVPLGLIAGFWSGRLERLMTLVMDSLYSFPGLILAIAITSVLGPGIFNVVVAIAVLYIPTYYRIARGQTLSVKEELYVEAARSLGVRPSGILLQYILPNVVPSLVVIFSVNVADAILTEAGLSFLGLGLPPTIPDWGIDLALGQNYMREASWLITYPGLMIMLVTLGFSMLGESLSEILNPRLAES
ncbi:MAG: ABC transporter permease subunit [Anaerolineae bacterium]|nr:ABC transporter permease subunit [Anaerolineae bacterium]